MKRLPIYLLAGVLTFAAIACDEQYTNYNDKAYVMFSEQEQFFLVEENQDFFSIDVATTVAAEQDRTFGVEVIDKGSNAIEGHHYRLLSNCVTIPAGELAGQVKVKGIYENITPTDSLGFILRLIVPEEMEWDDLYKDGTQTKVVMYKSCPFDINNFSGWCVVTSLLLNSYPGDNTSYQRLIYTDVHPTEENTVILHDCFYNSYDLTITFDPTDPANPLVTMDDDQLLSDEASVFGQILGDNKILTSHSNYYPSYFNSCQRFAVVWLYVYVKKMGAMVGTVGDFYNVFEWVSDEEAERLQREEGM
jgi:hypothetical protein